MNRVSIEVAGVTSTIIFIHRPRHFLKEEKDTESCILQRFKNLTRLDSLREFKLQTLFMIYI